MEQLSQKKTMITRYSEAGDTAFIVKLNLIDLDKLYSYSVTTSSQLLDTSTKTDLPRPRLAHHSVTYPYPRKGEVATRHHRLQPAVPEVKVILYKSRLELSYKYTTDTFGLT